MSVVRDFEKAFNRQDVDALVAAFNEIKGATPAAVAGAR